jgi:hypothetical protein
VSFINTGKLFPVHMMEAMILEADLLRNTLNISKHQDVQCWSIGVKREMVYSGGESQIGPTPLNR